MASIPMMPVPPNAAAGAPIQALQAAFDVGANLAELLQSQGIVTTRVQILSMSQLLWNFFCTICNLIYNLLKFIFSIITLLPCLTIFNRILDFFAMSPYSPISLIQSLIKLILFCGRVPPVAFLVETTDDTQFSLFVRDVRTKSERLSPTKKGLVKLDICVGGMDNEHVQLKIRKGEGRAYRSPAATNVSDCCPCAVFGTDYFILDAQDQLVAFIPQDPVEPCLLLDFMQAFRYFLANCHTCCCCGYLCYLISCRGYDEKPRVSYAYSSKRVDACTNLYEPLPEETLVATVIAIAPPIQQEQPIMRMNPPATTANMPLIGNENGLTIIDYGYCQTCPCNCAYQCDDHDGLHYESYDQDRATNCCNGRQLNANAKLAYLPQSIRSYIVSTFCPSATNLIVNVVAGIAPIDIYAFIKMAALAADAAEQARLIAAARNARTPFCSQQFIKRTKYRCYCDYAPSAYEYNGNQRIYAALYTIIQVYENYVN